MREIADGVYRVPARAANTYLIEAPKGLVLVDTGLPGSQKTILRAISKLDKTPSDLKLVLLTHRHLDHIGSAAVLKKETGTKLASHPFEKPYAAGTLVISAPTAWSLYGRIVRKLTTVEYYALKLFRIIKFQTTHVDLAADEESVLDGTGLDGSVLWTPGHTKGSISLFLNQPSIAIVGDLLRARRGRLVEPLLMESIPQTQASVKRLLDLGPEIICPGHGKPLPASKVRMTKRAVKPVIVAKKKEEEEDLEELTSGLF
ncbi:MAG TPA: MBL fold metallo-hydrolase [Candidatus Bathyarchaeia archaeon]|nr:MBL fold metallo-hydrolase [Candidatus Bathyarchaeia archaeon]